MTMRTVRFKVHRGLLEPLEPVPLVEGEEVTVSVSVGPETSTASAVLAVMQRLPKTDPALVDELERVIEASKLAVRTEGAFDQESR